MKILQDIRLLRTYKTRIVNRTRFGKRCRNFMFTFDPTTCLTNAKSEMESITSDHYHKQISFTAIRVLFQHFFFMIYIIYSLVIALRERFIWYKMQSSVYVEYTFKSAICEINMTSVVINSPMPLLELSSPKKIPLINHLAATNIT